MITGIGVDVVGLDRFAQKLEQTPRLRERLFATSEQGLPVHSLAARFAAKEALIKALGRSDGLVWTDIVVVSNEHGDPGFELRGGAAEVVAAHGVRRLHLSITHDAGVAVAFVVAEGGTDA
ncbi:holo-ACP synthase [Gryllotalpicola ginsengisoli]|uniref:holo-ACP synthase n=1 Tax=Gryllotalpicola ginsengisoli TaxID=444608 RepID=UPI0003B4A1C9|nr:holo-ACP synthase [Gryllotalpicola ginsengisoli]